MRPLTVAVIVACGAWLCASCGGTSRTGTDSQTHWLGQCESDQDCGGLSCVCGICTRLCDNSPACDDFAETASCLAVESCDPHEAASACGVLCESNAECSAVGPNLECRGGQCAGRSADPVPGPCAAMDARSNGDDCVQVVGYAFNGVSCEPVVCGCAGADCADIFATIDECDDAKMECYTEAGVDRECQADEQCVLVNRTCCGDLNEADATFAVSAWSEFAWCAAADCAPPIPVPKPTLHARCVDNRCYAIDVEPVALCEEDANCMVRSKGCCNCPIDEPPEALLAVATPDEYYDFIDCNVECDQCVQEPVTAATAECTAEGLCELVVE